MKKSVILLICLYALSSMAGCGKKGGNDDSFDAIKKKGYFIVGLDDEFPPMGFRGKNSEEIVGFDIDLAKETAKKLGLEVKFKPVAWDGIIFSLNKGDIDVVWNGMTITEERRQKIAFSKPYLNNRQIIVVAKGSPLKGKADLKGKIVGLQLGSSSEKALNSDQALVKSLKDVKKYENNILALMDLEAKRVDAVVVDEIVGRWNIAKKPGIYEVLGEDLGREEYGVGIRQRDVTFQQALDKALDEVKKSKAGDAISKKWFGENILVK